MKETKRQEKQKETKDQENKTSIRINGSIEKMRKGATGWQEKRNDVVAT